MPPRSRHARREEGRAVGDNAVAVVADTWWHAKTALEALPIVWDEGANAKVSSATIADLLKDGLDAEQAFVGNQTGDVKAALAGAAKKVEAVYAYPYQNHVTLEPMNATALYTPEKCEVWCSTQNGEQRSRRRRRPPAFPSHKCDVHKTFLGGGFGRRGLERLCQAGRPDRQGDAGHAGEAVVVARRGHDARLLSSDHAVQDDRRLRRQQEPDRTAHAHFRPVDPGDGAAGSACRTAWIRSTFQGLDQGGPEGAFGYDVPNLLIDHAMRNPHVPAGFWRGVNINHNAIYIESFMDELAHEIGDDPLEFRRKLMLKPKHLAVLNAVAEKAG